MAEQNLKGMKIAILVTDGFEQVELTEPRKALDQAGADTRIVSPKETRVRGWKFKDWGDDLPVDFKLNQTKPEDFDALHLPGGVINPDSLRIQPQAVAFKGIFRCRQAGGLNLPWPLDGYRGRRGARPARDLVAFAQDRPQKCRGRLGRRRGRGRSRPCHQSQARLRTPPVAPAMKSWAPRRFPRPTRCLPASFRRRA